MSLFNLESSIARAEQRLGSEARTRRARSDRGAFRLPDELTRALDRCLQTYERPATRALIADLDIFCRAHGYAAPSRATLYNYIAKAPSPGYRIRDLPSDVRDTLYNLDPEGVVPGHQLAFFCVNYGSARALMFAAGLPWLALYQAARMRGHRPQSHGILTAICRARNI
jgi:hypothetical protein